MTEDVEDVANLRRKKNLNSRAVGFGNAIDRLVGACRWQHRHSDTNSPLVYDDHHDDILLDRSLPEMSIDERHDELSDILS